MSNFLKAVEKVLEHEGGFVDHPEDKGGVTNWGITQSAYETFIGKTVTKEEMLIMPKGNAIAIYKEMYWDKIKGDFIKSYAKSFILFDQAVNRGPKSASKQAQKIVGVTADGVIGPQSIKAINDFNEKKFIDLYISDSKQFYKNIVSRDPSQMVFINGWMNRVSSIEKYAYKNRNKIAFTALVAGGLLTAYTIISKKRKT